MAEAAKPDNEEERLKALYSYDLLDRNVGVVYDNIIRIAADVCDVDISVIALIDSERQFFLARNNMKPQETPRAIAFCAHAILEPHKLFEIENATTDPRFKDNPLVTGEIGVRFYAAHPLTTPEGNALGGLCLIGKNPKTLNDVQRNTLIHLADVIMTLFDARKAEISAAKKLKEAKEIAESANTAKSEFLSTMSHELRTPLTSIKGAFGLLKSMISDELTGDKKELFEISIRNTDAMLLLVNELLDYEKIISGTMVIETRQHDIGALTSRVVQDNQSYASSKSVKFKFNTPQTPLFANVHEHRFEQVLRNLLSNAAKFSKPGSEVEISARLDKGVVIVSVKDYGIGMPEHFESKIFEPFTQIDSSQTREHSGTGLGLSISNSLVEGMGGLLYFESELDVGTTFFASFPVSK